MAAARIQEHDHTTTQIIQQSNSDFGHALQNMDLTISSEAFFPFIFFLLPALQSILKKIAFYVAHFFSPIHSSCLTKKVRKKTEISFILTHTWEKQLFESDAHGFVVLHVMKTRCMIR